MPRIGDPSRGAGLIVIRATDPPFSVSTAATWPARNTKRPTSATTPLATRTGVPSCGPTWEIVWSNLIQDRGGRALRSRILSSPTPN